MNPELYPYVIDKIISEGARDAFITPVIMKKGRPGVLLTVLAPQERLQTVIRLLHTETATTGVRYYRTERKILDRGERTVETEFGPLRVKTVDADGRTYLKPEFEDCKRIAIERNIPLIEVYRRLRIERD
jgi:pyridinium-3,5-bisthiocarboxylic acid mononucleotide nickel chelatase